MIFGTTGDIVVQNIFFKPSHIGFDNISMEIHAFLEFEENDGRISRTFPKVETKSLIFKLSSKEADPSDVF
jgi:hypothetical protein